MWAVRVFPVSLWDLPLDSMQLLQFFHSFCFMSFNDGIIPCRVFFRQCSARWDEGNRGSNVMLLRTVLYSMRFRRGEWVGERQKEEQKGMRMDDLRCVVLMEVCLTFEHIKHATRRWWLNIMIQYDSSGGESDDHDSRCVSTGCALQSSTWIYLNSSHWITFWWLQYLKWQTKNQIVIFSWLQLREMKRRIGTSLYRKIVICLMLLRKVGIEKAGDILRGERENT